MKMKKLIVALLLSSLFVIGAVQANQSKEYKSGIKPIFAQFQPIQFKKMVYSKPIFKAFNSRQRPGFTFSRATYINEKAFKSIDIKTKRSFSPEVAIKNKKRGNSNQEFIQMLIPLIKKENVKLAVLRKELLGLFRKIDFGHRLTDRQSKRLIKLAAQYRVKGNVLESSQVRDALKNKIDLIPVSLTLAQAANESAWGKSRFAKQGKNLFGIWTYDENKGIVPKGRKKGAKHLVRKFDSLGDSVSYYMYTLNSHPAYSELRDIRYQQRRNNEALSGFDMADGLTKYSAKGEEYVRLIQALITRHDWPELDNPSVRSL